MSLRLSLWFALPAAMLAAAAASCSNSSHSAGDAPDAPDSSPPSSDASSPPDASVARDGSVDLARRCSDDAWCLVPAPDLRLYGVPSLAFTGVATAASGEAWAVSTASALNLPQVSGGGPNSSHLLRFQDGEWHVVFGAGPGDKTPFPYLLNAIVADGANAVLAVGTSPRVASGDSHPVVLRVREDAKTVTIEEPANARGFVEAALASPTDLWTTDDLGRLYHGVIGGAGPIAWTVEPTPHGRCHPLWATSAGGIECGTGETPAPAYPGVDARSAGGTWVSTSVAGTFEFHAAREVAPGKSWIAGIARAPIAPAFFLGDEVGGYAKDPAAPPIALEAMWSRSATDVWAVGPVGRVYHQDGTSWSDAKVTFEDGPLSTTNWRAIAGLPTGEIWVVGDATSMHRSAP